jgi:hypothetical protein
MTIDLAALKTEITADPATLGYTGDDRADAKLLNDPTTGRSAARTVLSKDLLDYLSTRVDGSGTSLRYVLDMLIEYRDAGTVRGVAGAESGPEARRSAASMILFMLQAPDARFDVTESNVVSAFQSLGSAGPSILDSTTLNGIAALATTPDSRAQELFGQDVTPSDVADARRLP